MSEQHKHHESSGEQLKPTENSVEHQRNHYERKLTSAEKQHGSKEHLDNLHKAAEKHAISGKEHSAGEHQQVKNHPVLVNAQLKDMAFSRAMTRTRKRLSPISRGFSKVVHSSVVDKPSEFIGKTIARPQGMLWGSVFAFIGTSALLWITNHYGYEYNYLLVIILFVSGAIIGTAIEGIVYLLKSKR